MIIHPCLLTDFYKVFHYEQYPEGTGLVFSNFTPRKSYKNQYPYAVFYGLKYFIREYLKNRWNNFFHVLSGIRNKNHDNYLEFIYQSLGIKDKDFKHIKELSELGYLPIEINALPEGSKVPFGVPALTIHNTIPDFYWVTNLLETILSCTLWQASTSATIACRFREMLDHWANISGEPGFVDYQAHDFSFRGMSSLESAMISGAAHLNYFKGTDSIPAIFFSNEYYGKELNCGTSVPATEHSVMSSGGRDTEIDTYRRLITEIYPDGIVSIVSDTWDLWNVVSNILPMLKDDILKRNGKVVIRPDSGNPVSIICGSDNGIQMGLIQLLYDIFGGTVNSKGYKELDPHIGAIYGDSITYEIANEICEKLTAKGFASTNIVFGVGSYTYQYNTRDTLGWAMKATYCEVNGVGRAITKDPITDDGTKKSHSGILKVIKGENGILEVTQNCSWDDFRSSDNQLKTVFKDGKANE